MNKIIEKLVEIGLGIANDKIKTKTEKIAVEERLRKYLERQSKLNFNCTLQEEIDFGKLGEYIQTELLEDVKMYFYGKRKERGEARNNIITKSIAYAQAHTSLQKARTRKIVDTSIDILRKYYRSKTNRELRFLSAEIEDAIIEESYKQHQTQTGEIITAIENSKKSLVDGVINVMQPMSIDANSKLLAEGKTSEVEKNIAKVLDSIGVNHQLYPYYKFEYDSQKRVLLSKPLSDDAFKKYPPKISGEARVMMDGKYINKFDYKTIDYANRHQLAITIDIITAKKYLGDIVDPVQHEADDFVGEKIILPPKPFAPAFACSITIDDDVIFDYILLRIQEQLDDGTIVLSNKEQIDFSIKFTMKVNLASQEATYHLSVDAKCNEDTVKYLRIIKRAYSGGSIAIKALATGEEFSKGCLSNIDYSGVFKTIDDELAFVENVVAIEKYFNISIVIPENIPLEDFNTINYFAMLIKGDTYNSNWSRYEFPITVSEEFKKHISENTEKNFSLSYVGSVSANIFENELTIPIIRTFECVRYENLERLKEKATVLDAEDEIKVVILPGDGKSGVFLDMLHTNDNVDNY